MTAVLEAIGNRIHVLPDKVEEVTSGGILLPANAVDKAKSATMTGVVTDIGPEAYQGYDYGWVEIGDRVVFVKHSGWLGICGRLGEVRVLLDEDIIAILREEEEEYTDEETGT